MIDKIQQIKTKAENDIRSVTDAKGLEKLRVQYLGRKDGELNKILRGISELSGPEKGKVGSLANQVKKDIEGMLKKRQNELEGSSVSKDEHFDVTLPGKRPPEGHLHPLNKIRLEVEEIFQTMGFKVYEGNELTDLNYNFLKLNFPEDHPAMDSYDTFYIKGDEKKKLADRRVMRAHTSNMQVKIMENNEPPLRVIVPGRTFRNEATDASHEHTFHQIEGFVVDKDISIANLVNTQRELLRKIFNKDVNVRLRPGYFPFVEPGFELDCSCVICDGKGCSVCKQTGWVELIPCGMIHPNVLKAAGYPEGKYTGFAFGMGWSRLAMMKYGINDIRHFMGGDLRFLEQF